MISVTIDGTKLKVPLGTTVLQAARNAEVFLPTLCDHPSLKPYGGCRLCVVEVEGMRTLQASCTLPCFNDMVVHTGTPKVHQARKFILEMLFSERNHFCMFCQKTGGDCELQNAAYAEDMDHWSLQPDWNPYPVDGSHPYFVFDHNRCILCRRCVRACSELVGNRTLDVENRGARNDVVAGLGLPLGESSCVRCGTCLQICPTGALIDRRSAYLSKENQGERISTTCIGCSVGCGIEILVRDNYLVKIDGAWASPVNAGLLCEKGRFLALDERRERVFHPLVRKNGKLEQVGWEAALDLVVQRISEVQHEPEKGVAALASTRLPAEALHEFVELFRVGLGNDLVTSIEEDTTASGPGNGYPISNLDTLGRADLVIAIGVNLFESHQVLGFFIKRNLAKGTRLVVIDPFENDMKQVASYALEPSPASDEYLIQGIMAHLLSLGLEKNSPPPGFTPEAFSLEEVSGRTGIPAETIAAASEQIANARTPVFVYGTGLSHKNARGTLDLLASLANMSGATMLSPRGKANSLVAHYYQMDTSFELNGHQVAYLALGDDEPTPHIWEEVQKAPFLVAQVAYHSPITALADVVLPVEMWAEQLGHYMNLDGRVQPSYPAIRAPEEVRSNLEVIRALASKLNLNGKDHWEERLFRRAGMVGATPV